MKKYTLDKTQIWQRGSHTLYKIQYSEEFKHHIKETQGIDIEGGWIESEDNLSQEGDCYIANLDAAAYDGARVLDEAIVMDGATVRGPESIFLGNMSAGHYTYVVDGLIQCKIDERGWEVAVPQSYYDEMEIPDFHKHDLSPEQIEEREREEAKFRREFDWDSIHAETYGFSSDELADEDFVDDYEEDSNI